MGRGMFLRVDSQCISSGYNTHSHFHNFYKLT